MTKQNSSICSRGEKAKVMKQNAVLPLLHWQPGIVN